MKIAEFKVFQLYKITAPYFDFQSIQKSLLRYCEYLLIDKRPMKITFSLLKLLPLVDMASLALSG
jgi:hypothetical protein